MKKIERMTKVLRNLRLPVPVTPELRQAADDLERHIADLINQQLEIN